MKLDTVDRTKPVHRQITQETWIKGRPEKGDALCLGLWLAARYLPAMTDAQFQKVQDDVAQTIRTQYPMRYLSAQKGTASEVIASFNHDRRTTFEDVLLVLMWAGY